jgi:hypothetical protein
MEEVIIMMMKIWDYEEYHGNEKVTTKIGVSPLTKPAPKGLYPFTRFFKTSHNSTHPRTHLKGCPKSYIL